MASHISSATVLDRTAQGWHVLPQQGFDVAAFLQVWAVRQFQVWVILADHFSGVGGALLSLARGPSWVLRTDCLVRVSGLGLGLEQEFNKGLGLLITILGA